MKPALLPWLIGCLLVVTATATRASDRFSQLLNAEDRAASGLTRLTSDEVAVVDALVRRDTASRASATKDDKDAATFSQRLTADERKTAGLTKLTATELPKLDALIDRHQNAKLARTLLAPPVYLSRTASRLKEDDTKKAREIHGSFSLSYGWGKGGYSEKTGSMMLNFEDPDRGYSISVGYSESHIKGGHVYRDPYYRDYRDPFYRDPFNDPLRTSTPELVGPRP